MEHCAKGHPKTEENWKLRKAGGGRMEYRCTPCTRAARKRYHEGKKLEGDDGMTIHLTIPQKKAQYSDAILRMRDMGLWSEEGAAEALERVENLS